MSQYQSTLDVEGTVKIAPDLVWIVDGEVRACIDVKYKVEKNGQYPNADLNQMAAYCRRFGVGEGWLVYAAGSGVIESVRIVDGPNVTRTFVALNVNGAELLAQVERFAARVARLVCPVLPLR